MELGDLKQRLVEGDAEGSRELTKRGLEEGHDPQSILNDGLIAGMAVVGELFERNEYFIPEMLLSARAMYRALEVLRPALASTDFQPLGKAVMGTVQGDLHDIGKNLVGMMLEGSGFEVIDLGSNVPAERFVEAVKESGAQVVGLSALLTTTLPAMETTVRSLREYDPTGQIKVMVGGAPVTSAFAESIGADGYAEDAPAAAALARRLIGDVKSPQ
jgi:5-methyltetrahydrofolate--homocysteine methyltransferase